MNTLANQRKDEYGGNLENRLRLPLQIAQAVRNKWPAELPLFARISTTNWAQGPAELNTDYQAETEFSSWDVNQSIVLAQRLKKWGLI